MNKLVAVSGYFNPLHSGHLNLFEKAKKLGDRLMVIVNNDEQVKLKGSVPFMTETERLQIISGLKYVDGVVLSIDKDSSVCKTLRFLHPDIFANGGDRAMENTPEIFVCKELGIKTVFGIGGGKIQSSSELIKSAIKSASTYSNTKLLNQYQNEKEMGKL